mmetsp:Transcript_3609/g.8041  ORF Transcript_3609/g.8041 Transcript_3609/m.8041 type:complete len:95 (-) Transcript_3609:162-446(-)
METATTILSEALEVQDTANSGRRPLEPTPGRIRKEARRSAARSNAEKLFYLATSQAAALPADHGMACIARVTSRYYTCLRVGGIVLFGVGFLGL